MQKSILVVDDEADILDMLRYNLSKEGYNVLTARSGKAALEQAKHLPDLILLDVMLPEMDGWEVCKQLKSDPHTASIPTLFLTAKGSEVDEVLGLELGADDYIVKPLSVRKLLARVKAVLRRKESTLVDQQRMPEVVVVDRMEINVPNHSVKIDGADVVLTRREFQTLVHLAVNRGRVLSRERLLKVIWGEDVRVVDRTVDVHISKIRDKLGTCGEYIETVKGVGYRMKTGN